MGNLGLHTSAKYRETKLRPTDENIIAFDLGLLEAGNEEELRAAYKDAPKDKRSKMIAVLSAVYGQPRVAEKLGINVRTVKRARQKHPDLTMAALMTRNLSIAEMSERKAFQLISSIDVSKMEEREKARSAKLLADVADLQYSQISKMGKGEEEEDTEELIYRVRRKVKRHDDAIDITEEVNDESREEEDANKLLRGSEV